MITQSWDTALKGDPSCDYSVCTTWLMHEEKHYLLNVLRERLNYPDLRSQALALNTAYRPTAILIEAAGSGMSLAQELRADPHFLRVIERKPEKDKISRLAATLPVFQAGMVVLPKAADWLTAYEKELLGFPNGKYDDQVDSTSQYLMWQLERTRTSQFSCYWPNGPPGAPSGDNILDWRAH